MTMIEVTYLSSVPPPPFSFLSQVTFPNDLRNLSVSILKFLLRTDVAQPNYFGCSIPFFGGGAGVQLITSELPSSQ